MLSLLDILFPDATLKLIKQLSLLIMFPYPKTIQPSINLWDTPEKYNGCLLYTSDAAAES